MEGTNPIPLEKEVSDRLAKALMYIELPATEPALLDIIITFLQKPCKKIKFVRDNNPYEYVRVINEYPLVVKHYISEVDTLECNDKPFKLYVELHELEFKDFYSGRTVSVVYSIDKFELKESNS